MNIQQLGLWNKTQLKMNGMDDVSVRPYSYVRSVGDLKEAELWDGTRVHRTDDMFVNDTYGVVKCAPYELHFIYQVPENHKGWGLMCTCGSIAGVVGLNAYSKLASPTSTGLMIVCLHHNSTKNNVGIGEHADGSHE